MKQLVEKLRSLEQQMAEEKGAFLLFALFLREDAPGVWDLLISAPWAEANKGDALHYIVSKLKDVATPDELLKLSRLVIIEKAQPALAVIQSVVHSEHGLAEFENCNFSGMQIKHAYIITSRRDDTQSFVPADP